MYKRQALGLGGLALTKLPKGANANEKLPIVGKTKGYENHKIKISSGAENNAKSIPLKEQLSNEMLKAQGTKLEKIDVIARDVYKRQTIRSLLNQQMNV